MNRKVAEVKTPGRSRANMHRLPVPLLSVLTHITLVVLYAYSTYGQSASDMTDPNHSQKGAPWYITKSCSVVHTQSNYTYCQQAKACFATTICLL